MKASFKRSLVFLFFCFYGLLPVIAPAMRTIHGKGPLPKGVGAGWPDGCVVMANLPSRFSYWEWEMIGLSHTVFQYTCTSTDQFNTALDTFSIVVSPRRELIVYDGASTDTGMGKGRIDWTFEIWQADSARIKNDPLVAGLMAGNPYYSQPLPPPQVMLYLNPQNPIEWDKVKIPKNVTVIDKRVGNSIYKSSKGGVVRVSVKDLATSAPLAGATLELILNQPARRSAAYSGKSDESGIVFVCDIAPGIYRLRLSAPGHVTRQIDFYQNYGRTLETYDAALAPAAALSGTVVDKNGKPLEGAKVWISAVVGRDGLGYDMSTPDAVTDAAGRFKLDGLPAGEVCVRVSKDGYKEAHNNLTKDVRKVPGENIRITIGRAGILNGAVTNMELAPKGRRVLVGVDPEESPIGVGHWKAFCEPDGSFEVADLPAGRYVIYALIDNSSFSKKNTEVQHIEFEPDKDEPIELKLSRPALGSYE